MTTVLPPGLYPVMLTPFTDDGAIDWHGVDALTDWYLDNGATGLFAVCLSSEMYDLTDDERLALARRVVARAAPRGAPVVASGTFGGSIAVQADFVRRMADTGVAAVVALACQLAPAEATGLAPEAELRAGLEALLDATGDIPLGLYECPVPHHRTLSPELLGWAARTGHFLYHKDTVADLDPILAKITATQGTPLAFCNAHTPTALRSLAAGATGLSPIGANYYPHLYARLCATWRTQPEAARDLQRMLTVMEGVAVNKYLTAAKRGLGKRGLPIGTRCRVASRQWTYDDEALLDALLETVARLDAGDVS